MEKRKKKEIFTNRNFGLTNGNLKQLIQLLFSRFLFLFLFLSSHTKQTNKQKTFSNNLSLWYIKHLFHYLSPNHARNSKPISAEYKKWFKGRLRYLGSSFRGVGFRLNRLLETLDILLNILALVLVFQTESLVFHLLLLFSQIGLRLLLWGHLQHTHTHRLVMNDLSRERSKA